MSCFSDINELTPNQYIDTINGVEIWLKREDLLHPFISGNKYRKLKYNVQDAASVKKTILTFGGAFSNHIAATAAAGKQANIKTIGVIRGEELANDLSKTLAENSTLQFAHNNGMDLHFVTRQAYREKHTSIFQENLKKRFGEVLIVPEGGSNKRAIQGCTEILSKEDIENFTQVCCAVGTGGTISGIIQSAAQTRIIGFPALKAASLATAIAANVDTSNWQLNTNYIFGGYAKVPEALVVFINNFKNEYKIQLDPIYTGKMMYGIFDLCTKGVFPKNTRILAIHTGGLQGIAGINKRLKQKNSLQLI